MNQQAARPGQIADSPLNEAFAHAPVNLDSSTELLCRTLAKSTCRDGRLDGLCVGPVFHLQLVSLHVAFGQIGGSCHGPTGVLVEEQLGEYQLTVSKP